jgi:hypothetical protein
MKFLKKIVMKAIQSIYRMSIDGGDLQFDLGDIADPLFGYMSGTPVDRYLIGEAFSGVVDSYEQLNHSELRVLEIGGAEYSNRYFCKARKTSLEYLEGQPINLASAEIARGDLTVPRSELGELFDVVISTQVLTFVKDDQQAVKTYKALMNPQGFLIGSEPLVAPLSLFDDSRWGENRRYSPRSLLRLLQSEFEVLQFEILGNAVSSAALVLGIPVESLDRDLLGKTRASHGTRMFFVIRKS